MQQKFVSQETQPQAQKAAPVQLQRLPQQQRLAEIAPPRRQSRRCRKSLLRSVQVGFLKASAGVSLTLAMFALALVMVFPVFAIYYAAWDYFHPRYDSQYGVPLWAYAINVCLLLAPFAIGSLALHGLGKAAKKRATVLENKPLDNVDGGASLPDAEALVRASAAPLEVQRDVLLRASDGADAASEAYPKELLRATEREGVF